MRCLTFVSTYERSLEWATKGLILCLIRARILPMQVNNYCRDLVFLSQLMNSQGNHIVLIMTVQYNHPPEARVLEPSKNGTKVFSGSLLRNKNRPRDT